MQSLGLAASQMIAFFFETNNSYEYRFIIAHSDTHCLIITMQAPVAHLYKAAA